MNGVRILVVDDEPAIRRTLRANLSARGYDVRPSETGEEALAAAVTSPPSLVILDLMLPGLSGLDVCRALRAESAVPILVLSARGEERTKVRALDLGADDYLTKPFGMDELLARVRALLRRPRHGAEHGGDAACRRRSRSTSTRARPAAAASCSTSRRANSTCWPTWCATPARS